MDLLQFDNNLLALLSSYVLPGSLQSFLLLCRRSNRLFYAPGQGEFLWWVALRNAFGYSFLKHVVPNTSKQHLQRLTALASAARSGQSWRFHGFEREGENVKDSSKPASEFEWRIKVNDFREGAATGIISWKKLKSRWGNTTGMGVWRNENLVIDAFDPATGKLSCHGIQCEPGLGCGNYVFELSDNGLSISERGTNVSGHQQYMVGLAEDELILKPEEYTRELYFPGDPPGTSLQELLNTLQVV